MRAFQIAFLASSLVAGAFAAACGSSGSNPPSPAAGDGGASDAPVSTQGDDAASTPDAGEASAAMYPAFTPTDFPQVFDFGGPVMAAPKVVPIFFASDDATLVASLKDYVAKFGATLYWNKLSEYGVGPATGETPIDLPASENPPASWDDSQIQSFLGTKLADPHSGFPAPDGNTLYAFFTPPGVTVTTGAVTADGGVLDAGAAGVSASCTAFGGYHDNIVFGSQSTPVAYAVVPRCSSFGALMGLDAITGPASHEFAEAATDPFPSSIPAYASLDRPHSYWSRLLGGGEIGDMCAQNPQSFTKFSELAYTVQRLWSNKAEMTGGDPCLPVPTNEVYFNAFPVMNDTITTTLTAPDGGTQTVSVKGVHIPIGSSATVEVDLFSSAPMAPWALEAFASDQFSTGAMTSSYLGFAFDKTTGQNGDKVMLTITAKAAGRGNREPFLLVSKVGTKANEMLNFWAGEVGN